MSASLYDRGVSTFSPEGRLFQIEYANEAIKLGSTSVGVRCSDGVVLMVEKRISSPLLVPTSIEKVLEVDHHIGAAVSGLVADSKSLIEHGRVVAQHHTFTYNEPIRTESLAQALCDLSLRFGEGVDGEEPLMARPFGVSLLIAGWDRESGSCLIHTDPSGTYTKYEAKAIGAGSEGANEQLVAEFRNSLSMDDAQLLALRVLKQVMEDKLSPENIDVSLVTCTGFRALAVHEIAGLIEKLK